jgi:monoamine oxidase
MEEKNNAATNGANVNSNEPSGANTENKVEKLTLTQDELNAKLQAEADKRVTEALKTAKGNWQKEYEQKIQHERKEAERLARLSEEERQKELDEKYKNELSKREKDLFKKEMKLEAVNILSNKKLPVSFADMVIGDSAEDTHERIGAFEKAFKEAVESEVNTRIRGSKPVGGTQQANQPFDMNQFIRGQIRRG